MNAPAKGFTLIEVMIAAVIVAIVAAIAVPAYRDYVVKSRRSEATTALLGLQLAQERWRSNNQTYANNLGALGSPAATASNNYDLAIVNANATSYLIRATAAPAGSQTGDGPCQNFAVDENGPVSGNVGGVNYNAVCWSGN